LWFGSFLLLIQPSKRTAAAEVVKTFLALRRTGRGAALETAKSVIISRARISRVRKEPVMKIRKPLVLVLTGDGKGKTTSAFGQALRARGHGMRTLIVQFVKAPRKYGEVLAAENIDGIDVHSMGRGFIGEHGGDVPQEEHRSAAREALRFCREKTAGEDYDLLVLDEVNFALSAGLLTQEEILDFLDETAGRLTVILTGRGAPDYLIDRADLVSEIREVKHPYAAGLEAQKGIES
jgi:cob(I)alamin adenosyltransferase